MGSTLSSLTAAGHEGPRWRGSGRGGSGAAAAPAGAGAMGKEKPAPGAAAPASPRPLGQLRHPSAGGGLRLRGGVCLLFISVPPPPKKTKPAPKAIKISACLMNLATSFSPTQNMCGPCRWQRTDIPPIGRTRSLKSSGTASYCFQTRAETDKDIVKEKFGVAYYKTKSSKNLSTFGSISYLVNRTHIYSCVF